MLIKKYLSVMMLLASCCTVYADEDSGIAKLVERCNDNKEVDQCIQAAEYYKKRIQLDLAYKFYKKACLIDSNAKSGSVYVCSIAKNLESTFPADLFK